MNEKALFFEENHSHIFEDSNKLFYCNPNVNVPPAPILDEDVKPMLDPSNPHAPQLWATCVEVFDAIEIGRQIALIDSQLFMEARLGKKEASVNACISFSNRLSLWVATEILVCEGAKQRRRIFEKLVDGKFFHLFFTQ